MEVVAARGRGLELDGLYGPFHLKPLCHSIIQGGLLSSCSLFADDSCRNTLNFISQLVPSQGTCRFIW